MKSMDRSTVTRLSTLLAELCACDPATIRADAKLRSYGLDSLRAYELAILVEDAFGVQVQPDALEGLKAATVDELARYIEARVSSTAP